jgi:hypothetical protein
MTIKRAKLSDEKGSRGGGKQARLAGSACDRSEEMKTRAQKRSLVWPQQSLPGESPQQIQRSPTEKGKKTLRFQVSFKMEMGRWRK